MSYNVRPCSPSGTCNTLPLNVSTPIHYDYYGQMIVMSNLLRENQIRLESEVKEKYRWKKKYQKSMLLASNPKTIPSTTSSYLGIPWIVWILPVFILLVVFAAWVIWMLMKIDQKTLTTSQPIYYYYPSTAENPSLYYVTS